VKREVEKRFGQRFLTIERFELPRKNPVFLDLRGFRREVQRCLVSDYFQSSLPKDC
jgi:hypothetical protein